MSDNLIAYTAMPEPNQSYFAQTKGIPVVAEPMSGSTVGLLMILSTFQYQAPYMNPTYSNAASQAGKAAFIESGGQAMQDKLSAKATTEATSVAHTIGITDSEAGAVLGTAKVVRDKKLELNGPKIYFIKTHLTVGEDSSSVKLGINF